MGISLHIYSLTLMKFNGIDILSAILVGFNSSCESPHKLPSPPPFRLSSQTWVTVARLQQKPVGSFERRPESLAVWATAPPSPNNRVLTTLVLLFGPQSAPLPPFRFLFGKMGAGRGQLGEGEQALVGSAVSVWALHKGMERLYARHCHRPFISEGTFCILIP